MRAGSARRVRELRQRQQVLRNTASARLANDSAMVVQTPQELLASMPDGKALEVVTKHAESVGMRVVSLDFPFDFFSD